MIDTDRSPQRPETIGADVTTTFHFPPRRPRMLSSWLAVTLILGLGGCNTTPRPLDARDLPMFDGDRGTPIDWSTLVQRSSEVDVLDRDVIDESQLTVENVKYKDAGWRKDLKNVKIELIFDRRNGYLLRAFISVPSANDAITTQSLKEMLLRRLQNAGVLPQPSGASLRKASMLAKTSVPDVRMPKYEHNARQLSSRFVTDTSHAQSYNRKRELYRGVKRSSSYSSYIPRSKSDDDDDTQLSSGPTRERLSLL